MKVSIRRQGTIQTYEVPQLDDTMTVMDILDYIFDHASEQSVAQEWQFRDDLYSIVGYNYEFYHMNIVNLEDSTIHTFGESYYYMPYTLTGEIKTDIVDPTLELNGAKNIIPPSKPYSFAQYGSEWVHVYRNKASDRLI